MSTYTNKNKAASAANSNLQNILQNGRLAYLQDVIAFSYEFKDDIRKCAMASFRVDIANEPRIQFSGEYDIFIGRYLKIRTAINGNLNRYELGYIYVAPILFSDDFPTDLAEEIEYDDVFLYSREGEVKVLFDKSEGEIALGSDEVCITLSFDLLRALVIPLLHEKSYLDKYVKIDEENKIIYYEIPRVFCDKEFNNGISFGREAIEDAQRTASEIVSVFGEDVFENLTSRAISSKIFAFMESCYATRSFEVKS